MTNAALARMDAIMCKKFRANGMRDAATFWPYGKGISIPCTVQLDRGVQYQGFDGGATSAADVITAYRAEIGAADPEAKSYFQIGAELFFVDRVTEDSDESACVMLVTPKGC